MPTPCYLYLIPLKKYQVFKIGNALDLSARMRNMGILKHVDKKRIVAIELPDKDTALRLEKTVGRILALYNTREGIPEDIASGHTEFFRIDAWDHALELVSSLRRYGWDYKISKWLPAKERPPKVAKVVSPRTLAAKQKSDHEQKTWLRYNRAVFSPYWIRALEESAGSLVDFRLASKVDELDSYCKETTDELLLQEKAGEISSAERKWLQQAWVDSLVFYQPTWLLVYKESCADVFDRLTAVASKRGERSVSVPYAKLRGFAHLFLRSLHADGVTVLEVNPLVFSQPGTEALLRMLQGYNSDFLAY